MSDLDEIIERIRRGMQRELGRIVSTAVVNMISDNRWYQNWRSTDTREQWTKDDFHLLRYPEDFGTLGGAAVDFVVEVKPQLEQLIKSELTQALKELKEELPDTTFHGSSIRVKQNIRDGGYIDGVVDCRSAIDSKLKELEGL